MSFAGHVFDMIQRARQNSGLLKSKKDRLKKVREAYLNAKTTSSLLDNDINLSGENWKNYKNDLINKLRKQERKNIFFMTIFFIVLLVVFGFMAWLLFLFKN